MEGCRSEREGGCGLWGKAFSEGGGAVGGRMRRWERIRRRSSRGRVRRVGFGEEDGGEVVGMRVCVSFWISVLLCDAVSIWLRFGVGVLERIEVLSFFVGESSSSSCGTRHSSISSWHAICESR